MEFFRRTPKPKKPAIVLPKVSPPQAAPRFSLMRLFRREPTTPPPAKTDLTKAPITPPAVTKWRLFRSKPKAEPAVEIAPVVTPPKQSLLKRLFSRGDKTAAPVKIRKPLPRPIAILLNTVIMLALLWVLFWVSDYQHVTGYLIRYLTIDTKNMQATIQAEAATATRVAILSTVQAASTQAYETADAANRQTVVAQANLVATHWMEQQQFIQATNMAATRQAMAANRTATWVAVEQTQTAVAMQWGATATGNALALVEAADIRATRSAQELRWGTISASVRQATAQVEAANPPPQTGTDCLAPWTVIGAMVLSLRLKQSKANDR